MTEPPKCKNCIFWVGHPDPGKPMGQCRRWPPSPTLSVSGLRSYWPLVRPTDWCGEHATPVGVEEETAA